MRLLVVTLIAATLLLPACAGGEERTVPSAPAPAAVGVELQTAQPQYPRGTAPEIDMVLRNDGGQPCKLPSTATGAVEVMSVPLDIETNPNSPPTLVVSLQTPSDEGRTTSWPLDQPGRYRITARPAQVAGITDMCAVPSTSSTVEFGVQS